MFTCLGSQLGIISGLSPVWDPRFVWIVSDDSRGPTDCTSLVAVAMRGVVTDALATGLRVGAEVPSIRILNRLMFRRSCVGGQVLMPRGLGGIGWQMLDGISLVIIRIFGVVRLTSAAMLGVF